MDRSAIFVAGRAPLRHAAAIAQGDHPRVDYLSLLGSADTMLASFDDVAASDHLAVRMAARYAGPYVALAVLRAVAYRDAGHILAMSEDVGVFLAGAQLIARSHSQLAVITHGSYFRSFKWRLAAGILRYFPRLRFLCLSSALQRRLVQYHGVPAHKVINVAFGVDATFFRPLSGESNGRTIAAAGMASRDYKTLVSAAAGEEFMVKIAADSAWFRNTLDIEGQPIPPNVEVRSWGDYRGLRGLYASADFIVVPLYEAHHACGYAVILEAMAMGKAVITTRIASHSDFVVDGVTGFYVPPGDVKALRRQIRYLIDNPGVAREMGHEARQRVERHFTLEAYCARLAVGSGLPNPFPHLSGEQLSEAEIR